MVEMLNYVFLYWDIVLEIYVDKDLNLFYFVEVVL